MLAAGAIMTPAYGVPSAAALYFASRYLIPAYQNFDPNARSAVPKDMPEYKHRPKTAAAPCPRMQHGKKMTGTLKGTGTMHIRRR